MLLIGPTQVVQRLDTPSNTKASAYNAALAQREAWRSLPYADTYGGVNFVSFTSSSDLQWLPGTITSTTVASANFNAYIAYQRTDVPGVGYVTHYKAFCC